MQHSIGRQRVAVRQRRPENFRSEIVWKRSSAHSGTAQGRKLHGHIHDVIVFYTRGKTWAWNPVYTPYDEEYEDAFCRHVGARFGRNKQSSLVHIRRSRRYILRSPVCRVGVTVGWSGDIPGAGRSACNDGERAERRGRCR